MQKSINKQLESIEELNNGAYAVNCKFSSCHAVITSKSNYMTTKILKALIKENGKVSFGEMPQNLDNRFQVKIRTRQQEDFAEGDLLIIAENSNLLEENFSKIINSNQLNNLGEKEIIFIYQDGKIKYRASGGSFKEM